MSRSYSPDPLTGRQDRTVTAGVQTLLSISLLRLYRTGIYCIFLPPYKNNQKPWLPEEFKVILR